jgi:hypothetical protein
MNYPITLLTALLLAPLAELHAAPLVEPQGYSGKENRRHRALQRCTGTNYSVSVSFLYF